MLTWLSTEVIQRMIHEVDTSNEQFLKTIFVNETNRLGETPLHIACIKGHFPVVQTLNAWEADLTKKDKLGRTPIIVAWSSLHDEIVEYLRPLSLYAGMCQCFSFITFVNTSIGKLNC